MGWPAGLYFPFQFKGGKKKVLARQAGLRECACRKWNSTTAEVADLTDNYYYYVHEDELLVEVIRGLLFTCDLDRKVLDLFKGKTFNLIWWQQHLK